MFRRRWKLTFPFVGKRATDSALHESAKWATWEDLREMALLPPSATWTPPGLLSRLRAPKDQPKPKPPAHKGVFVGAYECGDQTHHLRHNGPEHVLVIDPTGSDKHDGLVLPTLYSCCENALVYDPTGQAWAATSGYRSKTLGHKVYNFDPSECGPSTVDAFNPLAEVRLDTDYDVADAQNIAAILADAEGNGLSDHRATAAQSLLSAVILHLCYRATRKHNRPVYLAEIEPFLQNCSSKETLEAMRDFPHRPNKTPHPMIKQEAESMIKMERREMSFVISMATSHLTLYRDPVIARNTSRSNWKIRDLVQGETPATVYLAVRPTDAERLRPITQLILTQIVHQLTTTMESKDERAVKAPRHRLLLLLDDFTALKRLTVIEEALEFMDYYGMKAYLTVRDIGQLKSVYGQDETITSNCQVRVCYRPSEPETADAISKMAKSRITPDDVRRLKVTEKYTNENMNGNIKTPGDLLVFVPGFRPVYGKQVVYPFDKEMHEARL